MESINKRVENVCLHSENTRQWCVKVCPCAGFTACTHLHHTTVLVCQETDFVVGEFMTIDDDDSCASIFCF